MVFKYNWLIVIYKNLISLSKFNLPLIGTFYMTHAARALQSHDLSGRELNCGSHTVHTFSTTQGHGEPPRMSDQPNAGATSETAQTWKTIHTKHTLSHPNKANMESWLWRPNDIRGPGGLKFPDICLTGEEKPLKNLTQETFPDRGLNPGPLRDKHACCHLLHSGGLYKNK